MSPGMSLWPQNSLFIRYAILSSRAWCQLWFCFIDAVPILWLKVFSKYIFLRVALVDATCAGALGLLIIIRWVHQSTCVSPIFNNIIISISGGSVSNALSRWPQGNCTSSRCCESHSHAVVVRRWFVVRDTTSHARFSSSPRSNNSLYESTVEISLLIRSQVDIVEQRLDLRQASPFYLQGDYFRKSALFCWMEYTLSKVSW